MKIENFSISRFTMERLDSSWRTASYSAKAVDGFIVQIMAGGFIGIGGTAAHPNNITGDDLERQLQGPVRDACLGQDPLSRQGISIRAEARKVHPRARIAMDLALHDLLGKIAGLPCHAFWGGPLRQSVKIVRMVGIKPPPDLRTAVGALMDEGYRAFKIKLGTSVADDVERIRDVRDTFGRKVWISVDANGAYTPAEAIELSKRLQEFDVSSIEQPVNYRDLTALAEVTRASAIPIMADQCVRDLSSALAVCQSGAAHIVSIKATNLGSIDRCRQIYEICRSFGLRVHFGGSATSALVDTAQAQLAASLADADKECEVGEFRGVRGEPVLGPKVQNGFAAD